MSSEAGGPTMPGHPRVPKALTTLRCPRVQATAAAPCHDQEPAQYLQAEQTSPLVVHGRAWRLALHSLNWFLRMIASAEWARRTVHSMKKYSSKILFRKNGKSINNIKTDR
jgi:hypothetical protein